MATSMTKLACVGVFVFVFVFVVFVFDVFVFVVSVFVFVVFVVFGKIGRMVWRHPDGDINEGCGSKKDDISLKRG